MDCGNTGEATEAGVNPLMSDYGNGEGVAAGAGHTDQSAYVNGLFMYTGDEVDKDDPAVLTATGYVGEITVHASSTPTMRMLQTLVVATVLRIRLSLRPSHEQRKSLIPRMASSPTPQP